MNTTIQGQLESTIRAMRDEATRLEGEATELRKHADAFGALLNGSQPKTAKPAKTAGLTHDSLLAKLPARFEIEDIRKAGGARLVASMVRRKRIRKLANGTYRKLG